MLRLVQELVQAAVQPAYCSAALYTAPPKQVRMLTQPPAPFLLVHLQSQCLEVRNMAGASAVKDAYLDHVLTCGSCLTKCALKPSSISSMTAQPCTTAIDPCCR